MIALASTAIAYTPTLLPAQFVPQSTPVVHAALPVTRWRAALRMLQAEVWSRAPNLHRAPAFSTNQPTSVSCLRTVN